ncbi:MAG TPA: TonB-dependent receptor [Gemmatimonadales bacterium]|nr:TonB-dependent receptor [Gemmatimonadales bacterium]
MNAALLALALMVQDTVVLQPVVVTATRFAVPVDMATSAVTVISGADLRAQGIRSVADALRLVPGVAVMQTSSFGSQTSLFVRGGESDYVKVLVDGVPQNQPGGWFDFANLTTDAVDRVEIVRGPVSVLYGSDAVTGVIQIFTRTGQGAPRGRIGFARGTYGSEWGTADLSGGTRGVSYGLALSRFTTDGIYAFNSRYRNGTASVGVRLTPDARTDANLSARYSDGVFHFPTGGGGELVDSNQFTAERGPSLALDAGRRLSSRVSLRMNLGWHQDQSRYIDDPDGPTDPGPPYHSKDVVRRFVGGARVELRATPDALVTLGTDYERQSQSGSTLDTTRHNTAAYAQLLAGADRPFSGIVGVRVDHNQQFGAHATGRAGVVWRIAAHTHARATAGTGFKEPTFYENFAAGFARGNPELKPERSTSWEVGVAQVLAGDQVTMRATYFHQRFNDLIQYSAAPVGPDSVNYVNVADAAARGVELGVQALLGTALSLDASYTYLDSRDLATHERLQRRPTHTGSLRLGSTFWTRGSASLAVVFTGDRDDLDYSTFPSPRVTLPPHARVDLAGTYALIRGHGVTPGLGLRARIENLLDARYEDIKNFPTPRRTLSLGAELRAGP